jgi:hypothetical protein
MEQKERTLFRGCSRFLLIAVCASLAAVSPVRAVEPGITVPAVQLADGIWTVHRHAIHAPAAARIGSFA